jgi:hypothetical protein
VVGRRLLQVEGVVKEVEEEVGSNAILRRHSHKGRGRRRQSRCSRRQPKLLQLAAAAVNNASLRLPRRQG